MIGGIVITQSAIISITPTIKITRSGDSAGVIISNTYIFYIHQISAVVVSGNARGTTLKDAEGSSNIVRDGVVIAKLTIISISPTIKITRSGDGAGVSTATADTFYIYQVGAVVISRYG